MIVKAISAMGDAMAKPFKGIAKPSKEIAHFPTKK
jgi:hypothetical protein